MYIPPKPPIGHLIAYEYLWLSRSEINDAAKTYPVAVVAAREIVGPVTLAYVLGISHSLPKPNDRALEVPRKLKRHLGLDEEPSWIYTNQVNVFAWAGPDLRPAVRLTTLPSAKDTCVIGPLPSDWFDEVKRHLVESYRLKLVRAIERKA